MKSLLSVLILVIASISSIAQEKTLLELQEFLNFEVDFPENLQVVSNATPIMGEQIEGLSYSAFDSSMYQLQYFRFNNTNVKSDLNLSISMIAKMLKMDSIETSFFSYDKLYGAKFTLKSSNCAATIQGKIIEQEDIMLQILFSTNSTDPHKIKIGEEFINSLNVNGLTSGSRLPTPLTTNCSCQANEERIEVLGGCYFTNFQLQSIPIFKVKDAQGNYLEQKNDTYTLVDTTQFSVLKLNEGWGGPFLRNGNLITSPSKTPITFSHGNLYLISDIYDPITQLYYNITFSVSKNGEFFVSELKQKK